MKTIHITYWSVREQAYHTTTCEVSNVENWIREIDPAKVFKTGGAIGNVRVTCNGRVVVDQIKGR